MFNPDKDLTDIHNLLTKDAELLSLMNLSSASAVDKAKRIIKESKWNDLVSNERRLCIYFRPSRSIRNDSFIEDVIQVDCHVPSGNGYHAYRIVARVQKLLNGHNVNCRYMNFIGQLGELSTADNFFCCGIRFKLNTQI